MLGEDSLAAPPLPHHLVKHVNIDRVQVTFGFGTHQNFPGQLSTHKASQVSLIDGLLNYQMVRVRLSFGLAKE